MENPSTTIRNSYPQSTTLLQRQIIQDLLRRDEKPSFGFSHGQDSKSMDDLHPRIETLNETYLDSCVALEAATFPEQERCSREKVRFRNVSKAVFFISHYSQCFSMSRYLWSLEFQRATSLCFDYRLLLTVLFVFEFISEFAHLSCSRFCDCFKLIPNSFSIVSPFVRSSLSVSSPLLNLELL